MKHKRRIFVAILTIALLIVGFTNTKIALAEAPKCDMTDGIITITITSKAATTNIRYRTIGFTVSTESSPLTEVAKGLTGPAAPLSPNGKFYLNDGEKTDVTAEGGLTTTTFKFSDIKVKNALKDVLNLNNLSANTKIYFNAIFQVYEVNGEKEYIHPGEITTWKDIVTDQNWGDPSVFTSYFNIATTFKPGVQLNTLYYDLDSSPYYKCELDSKNINEYVKWDSYVKNPDVINGKTYKLVGFYVKNKLTGTVTENRRVGDIINGATTTFTLTADYIINNASAKVQYGGMDVHMVYEEDTAKALYPNSLYYIYNGSTVKIGDLGQKTAGSSITWATLAKQNRPEDVFGSGKVYTLQGYYIAAKDKSTKLQGTTSLYKSTDGATDDDIINGSAIVIKNGLNIYIVYGEYTPPTPTPTPVPSATPVPAIPALVVPQGDREVHPLLSAVSTGIIAADARGAEKFVVQTGIPTTESLYTQVETSLYLIGYDLEKKVVVKEYPVKVKKTFTLTWKNAKDPTKTTTEAVTKEQTVTIKRACAYWKINKMEYYTIDNAVIHNEALPNGKSIMYPDSNYYSPPSLSTYSTDSEDYHIIDPVEDYGTVWLDPETIISPDANKPIVKTDNFLYEANKKIGEIKVRNDSILFNGVVVMDSDVYTKEAPALDNLSALNYTTAKTGINVLYKPNQIIKDTLANDTYYSSGTMTYKLNGSSVNAGSSTCSNAILNINQVKVHTPVICDPTISANNKKWVQLINPDDDYVPLVLDPDPSLSDFKVSISNTGKHSNRVGYYTRDMAWSLRSPNIVSYLAEYNNLYRNEVKFPFDVFKKSTSGEDDYIPKNTWIRIAFNSPSFYLPMWVEEGKYTVQFRSIAVNATNDSKINLQTEKYANTDPINYVATNAIKVQVSGRMYGLKITDVSDKRDWEEVFHYSGMSDLKVNGNYESGVTKTKYNKLYAYDYTVGTCDQYGNSTGRLQRFTFPLVNGSNPRWSNVGMMKKGYSVSFQLNTIGSRYGSGDSILIRTKFYYVDAKGKDRQEVDIYYTQYFNGKSHDLVKIGGAMDKTNIFTFRVDDLIPKSSWSRMADILNISYQKYKIKKLDLFTYGKMRIFSPLMTYDNLDYLQKIKALSEYSEIKNEGITPTDIVKRMQTWYGEYWLPADIHACPKGTDILNYAKMKGITYKEKWWLKGGFIIVNFEIVTLDSDGNEQLSYTNINNSLNGYCSMWNMENYARYKKSYQGRVKGSFEISFVPGDFLAYYSDISLRDDYTTYIIN